MIRKTIPTFGKDLRYLSRQHSSGRIRVFGHPAHWVVTLFIAVAVGIWLGSAPDAAVERSSITLKKQIELVLEQDPVPASETQLKEHVESGIDIASMPTMESFQGVAAIKETTPGFGVTLASFDTADTANTTEPNAKPQPVSAGVNANLSDAQNALSARPSAAAAPEPEKELPETSAFRTALIGNQFKFEAATPSFEFSNALILTWLRRLRSVNYQKPNRWSAFELAPI